MGLEKEKPTVTTILVTGGAGFIGSNFTRLLLGRWTDARIVNLDALTYAGNPRNLEGLDATGRHILVHGDICDTQLVRKLFAEHRITQVVHFAAESHVDRSIEGPAEFIRTNINGTFTLLEAARKAWLENLSPGSPITGLTRHRFLHVSTDEVYGSLGDTGHFTEETPYDPRSPYSASKASSDHLVRAYHHTYGLPVLVTNCSNNYGPYQFPEKLIPLVINNARNGKELPVYGDGKNVRDWLYVEDHCDALLRVLEEGLPGQTYNIGGNNEKQNIQIVHTVCDLVDERLGLLPGSEARRSLIRFVKDRPGHDRRYAIDATKIRDELGWQPSVTFEEGIRKTIDWYLDNDEWMTSVIDGSYREYYESNYGDRLSAVTGERGNPLPPFSNPSPATRHPSPVTRHCSNTRHSSPGSPVTAVKVPRLALIGHNGMLAQAVWRTMGGNYEVTGFDLPAFDLTDRDQVLQSMEAAAPQVIINCAAFTDVDGCESREQLAARVNGDGPAYLAEAARETGATLVHISTDYVFDGTKTEPYLENDPPNPRSAYGRTKLAGEQAVISSGLTQFFIVRTAWLYGPGGKNFVETMLRLARERDELRVVADQIGSPTTTEDLARAIFNLLALEHPSPVTRDAHGGANVASPRGAEAVHPSPQPPPYGLYHFTNEGSCSWHGFAEAIVANRDEEPLGRTVTVRPIRTEEYPVPAPRPAYSVLSTTKYEKATGATVPGWQDGLTRYFMARDE